MTDFDSRPGKNSGEESVVSDALRKARSSVAEVCADFESAAISNADYLLEFPSVAHAERAANKLIGECMEHDPAVLKDMLRTGSGNDLVLIRFTIDQLEFYGEASVEFLVDAARHPTPSIAMDAILSLSRASTEKTGQCLNEFLFRPGLSDRELDIAFTLLANQQRELIKYAEPALLNLLKGENEMAKMAAKLFLNLLNSEPI